MIQDLISKYFPDHPPSSTMSFEKGMYVGLVWETTFLYIKFYYSFNNTHPTEVYVEDQVHNEALTLQFKNEDNAAEFVKLLFETISI